LGITYNFFKLFRPIIGLLLGTPLTYFQDGLYSQHNADFLKDPAFIRSYRIATASDHGFGKDLHIEWRVFICLWAASQSLTRDGDFVECGVNSGIFSRAITDYYSFEKLDRSFYLVDTFEGIPENQYLPSEIEHGLLKRYHYVDKFQQVQETFSKYPNVRFVKGRIPETLPEIATKKIAYLCLDMNAVVPEIAAAEYLWEFLVPGAVVVLDDYGFPHHLVQKTAFDAFAADRGVRVMGLPTGQGIIIKP
jgi:O-methyltransferase